MTEPSLINELHEALEALLGPAIVSTVDWTSLRPMSGSELREALPTGLVFWSLLEAKSLCFKLDRRCGKVIHLLTLKQRIQSKDPKLAEAAISVAVARLRRASRNTHELRDFPGLFVYACCVDHGKDADRALPSIAEDLSTAAKQADSKFFSLLTEIRERSKSGAAEGSYKDCISTHLINLWLPLELYDLKSATDISNRVSDALPLLGWQIKSKSVTASAVRRNITRLKLYQAK